ncbi:AMP-dependent synthetase/ligase [Gordonia sp. VNK21]|uniref:AMP-dependent synthetase/ligase n=1 Tax=Gordonia sp. VNK21 TaxID=3382483 RepID=UPI0038D4AAAF
MTSTLHNEMPVPSTVVRQFRDRVSDSADRIAYRWPGADGAAWENMTWRMVGTSVERWAAGLLALGIGPEQRVGIAASTRVEWILADLAILSAGAATTTVYPSTTAADVAHIVSDSGCAVVFAEDSAQVAKLREHRAALPELHRIVLIDGPAEDEWTITVEELERLGDEYLRADPDAVTRAGDEVTPDRLATLIYTSGTTGAPKGVRLTHGAWAYQGDVGRRLGTLDETDLQFLWLPTAHSFGKVLLAIQLTCGFPTAIDGRVDRIIDNLPIVEPTFMGAAPRIFEKAYARIVASQESAGRVKRAVFRRAFAVGMRVDELKRTRRPIPIVLRLQWAAADRLVFAKVRARFGGRLRFFISGSAALNDDIARWFHAAGIRIFEGYGLTESSAASFVNTPDSYRIGTVGSVFPGAEVRIDDNGEVQLRGPHVMDGYHNLPEATAQAITADGWLRTGDKGALDEDGFLRITGRIKDLFKTSGGKYVAPAAIEAKFKALCPYVSQFLVFGDRRNYCVALVTMDQAEIAGWARDHRIPGDYRAVVTSPAVRQMVAGYVDELNRGLNRWETIKRFEILERDLSLASGELTPSLKVRRAVVEADNATTIAALYGDPAGPEPVEATPATARRRRREAVPATGES